MSNQENNRQQRGRNDDPKRALWRPLLWIFALTSITAGILFSRDFFVELINNQKFETAAKRQEKPIPESEIPKPSIEPVALEIPVAHITAPVVPVGLEPDHTLHVPASDTQVGWYIYSPPPGEVGPSILDGHYDSAIGPAVFYSLNSVKPGDSILIKRKDGSTAVFTVTSTEIHPQDNFPTSEVYGSIPYPGLRVITCAGTYDRDRKSYTDNLIVFAKLDHIVPLSSSP